MEGPQNISSPVYCFSGCYLARSGKPPRMEIAQPLQATTSTVWLSSAENTSLYIQYEHILFQCMSVVSCPSAVHHCEETSSTSSTTSLQVLVGCCLVTPKLPLLQPNSLNHCSQGKCSSFLSILVASAGLSPGAFPGLGGQGGR